MHIESVELRNFRCFGDIPTKAQINPGVTGFVGDNGAGKSSTLEALKRLFSPNPAERKLQKIDVHFGPGEDSQSITEREIVIDVVFGFSNASKIPHLFSDVFFDATNNQLKVRLLLEGHYKNSDSIEDDIEVKIYTVRTLEKVPFGPDDERKTPIRGKPTQFAELVYIPAHRDSLSVTRHALKNVLRRLELSADWTETTKSKSLSFAKELETNLRKVPAIELLTNDLKTLWRSLHDGHYEAAPLVSVVATEFEQLIRDLTLRFEKSPGGGHRQLEELSEGQVSLLYFALSATLHNLVAKMDAKTPGKLKGFKSLDFVPAPLTIFALEEPENHLAPFYLPRLVNLLESIIKSSSAQSFVTSHSTSILKRIAPNNVRYFHNCSSKLTSQILELPLPEEKTEANSFLTQVILSNPEIYFARRVIIGEGDSERIVIPRIAEAFDLALDPAFVAFVPIGGRHAQHLWKLLNGLKIPHITVLDFDLGRHNGGMGRVKNAASWLKDIGLANDPIKVSTNTQLTPKHFDDWMKWTESLNIFYSAPLDLDMMMIRSFPRAYEPSRDFDKEKDEPSDIERSVFGKKGAGNKEAAKTSTPFTIEELHAYKNLFKSRSKPASHYSALAKLDNETIRRNCPPPLKRLIEKATEKLSPSSDSEGAK